MNKKLAAFAAAALMTACSAAAILAIGGFAVMNTTGVAPASAQGSKATNASLVSQSQTKQLQDQVAQYEARDQQYQTREQQYQQALSQAQSQIQADQQQFQQFQMLLAALQQRGLITITSDGGILINRGGGD